MELVDSKNNKLDMRELIVRALQLEKRATANPNSIQDMTTFFIAQRGLKSPNKLRGRFLNVDTGKNFVQNFYNYIAHLQKDGVTHYTSEVKEKSLVPALQLVHAKLQNVDTTVSIATLENSSSHGLLVKLGKQPIRMLE